MTGKRARRLFAGAAAVVALAVAASVALAAQSADPKTVSTQRGVAKTITLSGTSDLGVAAFNITGGPSHGALDLPTTGSMVCLPGSGTFDCSADVQYTPTGSYEGSDSFTYDVQDLDGTSGDATVSITVGSAPVAVDDPGAGCGDHSATGGSFTIIEDWPDPFLFWGGCGLLANDTDSDADSLTWQVDSGPSHGSLVKVDESAFAYQPDPNFSTTAGDQPGGSWTSDSFTYLASDGALTDSAQMKIWVAPINDPPTFTAGADTVSVGEDSGAYTAAWATNVSPGPNESDQTVHFDIVNLDVTGVPNLFSADPAIDATGVLTFTPGPNQFGLAEVTVKAVDDGGLNDYGVTYPGLPAPNDTSGEVTFAIVINPVNDAPTFTPGANVTVNQDSPAFTGSGWATDISTGPADESGQTLAFSFTADDNPTLFSVAPAVAPDGTLTFTPAAARSGTAHLSLRAQDSGGTANGGVDTSGSANVTIRINANPNAVPDTVNVAENSPGTHMNLLSNDTSLPDPPEVLTITAVSNDGVLGPVHGSLIVAVNGSSVTYVPTRGYYGSDFFRYYIADPSGGTDFATVFVTIVKDVTPPTVATPAQRIRQGVAMTSTGLLGLVTWSGSDAGVGIGHYELQRSTNGGAWTNVGLTSPAATTAYVTYALGPTTYRFRVRGVDANGNTSAWLYTATFHNARYEEGNTALRYGGSWFLALNANDSGGAAKYTTVNGRYVTMTRSFRDIGVVTMKGPGRGSIAIYVDGAYKGTFSLAAATTRYRQVVWTAHYGLTTHTIKVVAIGNVRLDFDCFVTLY